MNETRSDSRNLHRPDTLTKFVLHVPDNISITNESKRKSLEGNRLQEREEIALVVTYINDYFFF